jgi:hypothetical protein
MILIEGPAKSGAIVHIAAAAVFTRAIPTPIGIISVCKRIHKL